MSPETRKLWRLVQRYARARIADSWMGYKPVDEHDAIAEELSNAKAAVLASLISPEDAYDCGYSSGTERIWPLEDTTSYEAARKQNLEALREERQ